MSPVVVAPMVGILGVEKVKEVPTVWRDEQGRQEIIGGEELVLSWNGDHRILDGATVAKSAERTGMLLENADIEVGGESLYQ